MERKEGKEDINERRVGRRKKQRIGRRKQRIKKRNRKYKGILTENRKNRK